MRLLFTTFAGLVAGFVGLRWAPTVTLRRDVVPVDASPAVVVAELRRRFLSGPENILASGDDRVVRRFEGTEGRFSYRTVELVTFEPDAVTFEQLAGPFQSCHERFDLSATNTGSTVTHTGTFQLRGGIWTAALAVGPVKHAFEHHVQTHLQALSAEL
jgi:hypothetical protein